jgi:hypothetical protein
MRTLLDQLEQSLNAKLYYLSLMTALTLPDIAGAMDAEDGQAKETRYVALYEKYVRPEFQIAVQRLETARQPTPASPHRRTVFIEPGAPFVVHNCMSDALVVDAPSFCREMVAGAQCCGGVGTLPTQLRFVRRHPDGLLPYIKAASSTSTGTTANTDGERRPSPSS